MDTGLVFGIIFAAIVMGLLLFFGFRYINDMMAAGCDSQAGQQVTNIRNVAKSVLTFSKGSTQSVKILMPACFSKMCFIDPGHPEVANVMAGWAPGDIENIMVSRYKYNIIAYRNGGGIDGYIVEKMKPDVNFCITSTGDITLKNAGTYVEIVSP